MIKRHTTRRDGGLGAAWLAEALLGAASYDRVAGYFRSSVLEFAEEAYEQVEGKVRIICNAHLDPRDIETAKSVAGAIRRNWNSGPPHDVAGPEGRAKYERLARLLASGKLEVTVLPQAAFGLVHGKAGVIRYTGGGTRAFIGSGNETREGFEAHYEMLWEDDSAEAAAWVQAEFDALLTHTDARPLNKALTEIVEKTLGWIPVPLSAWNPAESPGAPFAESPVELVGTGLMPHQKYFIGAVMKDVATFGGAQYILADEVGLGKTLQLGMAAAMLALKEHLPALILAPKNVAPQFRDDIWTNLGVPSACWDGGAWVTEDEQVWPGPITECPRQIALVSTSRVFAETDDVKQLLLRQWACVVLDEAHRARTNQTDDQDGDANNLRKFMVTLAPRARSLLLGTATPVQMDRQELWDLLQLLDLSSVRKAGGYGRVLGTATSKWRKPGPALDAAQGTLPVADTPTSCFEWLCDPLPPRWESRHDETHTLGEIWDALSDKAPDAWHVNASRAAQFEPSVRDDLCSHFRELVAHHNPVIRHTVKRTRDGLAANPAMAGYGNLLKKIDVDAIDTPIEMSEPLREAYAEAGEFCRLIAKRKKSAGLLKTLVLRRMGSSLNAGRSTMRKFLDGSVDSDGEANEIRNDSRALEPDESACLVRALEHVESCGDADPKMQAVLDVLEGRTTGAQGAWIPLGCILFSMYYDTVSWMAKRLSLHFPATPIGVYGGGAKSYILLNGEPTPTSRKMLVDEVAARRLKVLVATDAASEGLNFQALATVVNIDLPWNPARLEQRVGRVKRIGQAAARVKVLNLRYAGSVEDAVHKKLSIRLQEVNKIFGTVPDHFEDVWVTAALEGIEVAESKLFSKPIEHPFKDHYDSSVDTSDWDRVAQKVPLAQVQAALRKAW